MIVPMKHLTLLCLASEQEATLEALRRLGIVHVNADAPGSDAFLQAEARRDEAERALQILADAADGKPFSPAKGGERPDEAVLTSPLPEIHPDRAVADVLAVAAQRQSLSVFVNEVDAAEALYAPYGDIDPKKAEALAESGFTIQLFKAAPGTETAVRKALAAFGGNVAGEILNHDNRGVYGVLIAQGAMPVLPEGFMPVAMPGASTATLRKRAEFAWCRIVALNDILKKAAPLLDNVRAEAGLRKEEAAFRKVADAMQATENVAWITGWMPAENQDALEAAAKAAGWGILTRAPQPGEAVPTLLRPPKLFRPVVELFKGLSIFPTYEETDISVPFFCFFSIFFAMLVGDGGYGTITLALTLWVWKKAKRGTPKGWFILLTCFSVSTIIWGVLSNCWFGESVGFLDNPVSRWLDNRPGGADEHYHHIMLICFTLGALHLSLARLWNAVLRFPDSKFLAELGWAGVIAFMYCMTCSIVGIFTPPKFIYYVLTVSVILIFGFTLKKSELKANAITFGMLPLNIVSALGDIISYVRLFAVGLASVKVAQNFNQMAVGLSLPIWLKFIPMVLILLVGHLLNYAMAGLSILVHAVRLNTLEFSNHKGISWAGYAFKPFKKTM
ncbi:MAG: hypothetical protein J6Z49_11485 [Kiritimatiellae bacterium]|nr:hypothetical protein [Kiritimatiellia bacterium]